MRKPIDRRPESPMPGPFFSNRANSRSFGRRQEARAAAYLKDRGLRLIANNFSCIIGELDLVMLDAGDVLVFIEVRYRSNRNFGSALESITPGKQMRVRNTAAKFLQVNPCWRGYPCRFDVVGISPSRDGKNLQIRWVKSAFS